MQVVIPNSTTVKAGAYLITTVGGDLPTLNRLPTQVVAVAQQLADRIEKGRNARRTHRGETADGQVVVVYRLNESEDLTHERLDNWTHRVASLSSELECDVAVVLPGIASDPKRPRRILTSLAVAGYQFRAFRSPSDKRAKTVDQRRALVIPPSRHRSAYSAARKASLAIGAGVRWARDLANTPPNVATPAWMAEQARDYFRSQGARVEVLTEKGIDQRRMGGLAAVGGGSANKPRCVRVRIGYRGPKVALVGKGVTFDTGGISIKPAAAMDEMKYDKSGACAVMGIGRAAVDLGLPIRLELYLPLAENMLDGNSYRPGDIVRCMNGKTVEILNTDAEGRMILADALAWAAQGKPDYLVDFATLTGACVVALGESTAGLFTRDDELAEQLLRSAGGAGEYLWRLPLWDHFSKQIEGRHGDLKNVGPRWGGASTAAAFLREFVDGAQRWAHIDLAGPAYRAPQGSTRKEATGYGVAMTVEWLRSLA